MRSKGKAIVQNLLGNIIGQGYLGMRSKGMIIGQGHCLVMLKNKVEFLSLCFNMFYVL